MVGFGIMLGFNMKDRQLILNRFLISLQECFEYINSDKRVQRFFKAVEPSSHIKEGWETVNVLIKRFGDDLNVSSAGDVFNKSSEYIEDIRDLTFHKLDDTGLKIE